MKKIKRIFLVVLSLFMILCASACGSIDTSKVKVYGVNDWCDDLEDISVRELEFDNTSHKWVLGTHLDNSNKWKMLNNTSHNYGWLYMPVKSKFMDRENTLISVSMTVVMEEDTDGYFVFKTDADGYSFRQDSFRAEAGEETIINFEFNEPITDVFRRMSDGTYTLRIEYAEYVFFTEWSEVPAGATTGHIDELDYYVSYADSDVAYTIKEITFTFK